MTWQNWPIHVCILYQCEWLTAVPIDSNLASKVKGNGSKNIIASCMERCGGIGCAERGQDQCQGKELNIWCIGESCRESMHGWHRGWDHWRNVPRSLSMNMHGQKTTLWVALWGSHYGERGGTDWGIRIWALIPSWRWREKLENRSCSKVWWRTITSWLPARDNNRFPVRSDAERWGQWA